MKKFKKKKKKKNFYSRAGQDGRSDEDKQTIFFGGGLIMYSYTPRILRACCSQSKFRILKIRESSARALFLLQLHSEHVAQCLRERRVELIYANVGLIYFLNG